MVIMKIQDYDNKMLDLLNDPTYKILRKDPTSTIQKLTNNMAKRLADLKLIDRHTLHKLQTHTSTCPRIYGQPKAHKPNLPLRPVVPNITAPTYQLSKFIANILQTTFTSQHNIKDSFNFVEEITTITIPPEHVLVSFDVVSLFTNIPKELVIRNIIFRWTDIKKGTDINLDVFLEMVELCLNNSYFMFRDKYYQQTFGTVMRIADYVMEDLLDTVITKLNFTIPVLKKYVDDLFLVLPKPLVEHTLNIFNQFNQHLQFTMEIEKSGKLPFLDTLIIRKEDHTLRTVWYSKPISSGRLLNYNSFHPTNMKLNVASNFIKRVMQLTTDTPIEQQKHVIFQNLRRNDYPSALINRLMNRIKTELITGQQHHGHHPLPTSSPPLPAPTPTEPQDQPPPLSIPNIQILTPSIIAILRRDFPLIKIATRTTQNIKTLLKSVKDPVSPLDQHNVIYSIPCIDCDNVYIGMTTNQLKKRLSGHRSNVNKLIETQTNTLNLDVIQANTALVQHMIDTEHTFDLEGTKTVVRTLRPTALPVLEMCHIQNTPHTVNYRTDVDNLNTTYAGILHTVKTTLMCRKQSRHTTRNTITDTIGQT
ncbi:uncharacterized protein LOC134208976 [Armigeres subalbatus]|uniref:uncharacterized protein LOC134208976 n=1 Tax=Armigeres subalbatus TaxID=124917 RepID=UPI002ED0DA75